MRNFQFGYVVDGKFYRRTVQAATMDEAIALFLKERPTADIVSSVEV